MKGSEVSFHKANISIQTYDSVSRQIMLNDFDTSQIIYIDNDCYINNPNKKGLTY